MFSFINELIRKINTSLIQVFTATNLHKMSMTLCTIFWDDIFTDSFTKMHEKNCISKNIKLVRDFEIMESSFSQNESSRPWWYSYRALNNFKNNTLRKWLPFQFFPFWLSQGKGSQLLVFSNKEWTGLSLQPMVPSVVLMHLCDFYL